MMGDAGMSNEKVMIRRKNVYLEVSPESVESYVAKGYDVLDSTGNVVRKSVPNNITALQSLCNEQLAKIKKLEDRVKELEAQLTTKEQTPAQAGIPVGTKAKASKTKSKK